MKSPSNEAGGREVAPDVIALLEKRATIEQWIARLESQRGSVSEKVLERVRADYERRLAETLEALGSHRSAVEDQLLSASDRLSAAEARRAESEERLEEGRLRTLIGELSDEEWDLERTALEGAVGAATSEETELRGEVDRLTQLIDQLNEDGLVPADDEVTIGFDDVAIPSARVSETMSEPPIHSAAVPDLDRGIEAPASIFADEDPFLAGIDRVLSDGEDPEERPAAAIGFLDEEPQEDTAPKPGLKCGECGYTNDLSAWFCGVCGADVG